MKKIILILTMFFVSTITYAEKTTNGQYTCTVKERYTAFFWPTKIKKDDRGLVEFQKDMKNNYIINLKITLKGNDAIVSVKNKDTPNTKDETKFIKMKDGFNGMRTAYTSVENDKQSTTWLFKVDKGNEWRYFGRNIFSTQDMDVGLMVFNCK